MSKDLEVLKSDVKKLMLKDWTKTEVKKLSEFMEDVIVATMVVNKLPIHLVSKHFCYHCEEPVKVNKAGTWIICCECGYQEEAV